MRYDRIGSMFLYIIKLHTSFSVVLSWIKNPNRLVYPQFKLIFQNGSGFHILFEMSICYLLIIMKNLVPQYIHISSLICMLWVKWRVLIIFGVYFCVLEFLFVLSVYEAHIFVVNFYILNCSYDFNYAFWLNGIWLSIKMDIIISILFLEFFFVSMLARA